MTGNEKQRVALGVDVGGTNTVFGLVDEAGELIDEGSFPTRGNEPFEQFAERLAAGITQSVAGLGSHRELVGVGVGLPNGNRRTGWICDPPNLAWGRVNAREVLSTRLGLPVVICNDADAAAVGEMCFGAAGQMSDFVLVTLGTGLGSGIVVNGALVAGAGDAAGELGHVIAVRGGRRCGCGRDGCLETYVSATGIRSSALEWRDNWQGTGALDGIEASVLTSKMVFEAATDGDRYSLHVFEKTGRILGRVLADVTTLLSPEAFIFFGGVAQAGEMLLGPARASLEENLMPVMRGTAKIIASGLLGRNIAVLGSAAMALGLLR